MTLTIPADTAPLPHHLLPGSNVGIGWHNVQRKRLKKFATQYLAEAPEAVAVLRSQGEVDTSLPAVQATRAGFNELRVRLPVLNQYYIYTGMHGGTPDATVLAHIKAIVLAWVTKNQPTGKPIDETNVESLLRVIKSRWVDFSAGEQSQINTWLLALKAAKEAWAFVPLPGEGRLLYGNHYTHHYKILLLLYDVLGNTTAYNNTLNVLDTFATQNFPFGNTAVIVPETFAIVGASISEQRFDIDGSYASRFPAGHTFAISGNTQGNNGSYTVQSVQYLSGSNKTRIFVTTALAGNGGGGTLTENFRNDIHDMVRLATTAGESIDYIRRDALHYHQYNLEPWLEIALQQGGTRYQSIVDAAFTFLSNRVLSPSVKHYEFTATSDSFDALRWQASRSEYLAPQSLYRPDKLARVVLAYHYVKQRLNSSFQVDERLLSMAIRSSQLPSCWPYYFRWAFAGLYG